MRFAYIFCLGLLFLVCVAGGALAEERPNVVLVITDDQGYGDVGAHGNEMIQTPHLDRLHSESVRLTDFHVDPTCSPTRAALMTGRYSTRTGVWHTIQGRSLMSPEERTLPEVFAANGYRTGMFGKWHLGDNAPLRPQDRGFHQVLHHGGGGVGQTPDWWGNDYFDDTYIRGDGTPEQFTGYCTDVWFAEALKFIEAEKETAAPFFCYLSTNAPHGPFLVADSYKQPYLEAGVPEPMASFYGMITNIDENMGKLREKLAAWNLAENTILIFMSDNGTAAGVARPNQEGEWRGFNAGMRARKGSEYDGGHRVPFFIHWPAGGLAGGRDVNQLTAHIDILPTLVELCGMEKPDGPPIDGVSLIDVLQGDEDRLRDRTLLVHSQRLAEVEKWRKCAVMTEQWRLVNGKELYDIRADPGQESDVASAHPEVVSQLREAYEEWWESLSPAFDGYVRIALGSEREDPARLTCHDWHPEDDRLVPWNQTAVQRDPEQNGHWMVEVTRAGTYEFILRMRPEQVPYPLPPGTAKVEVRSETETREGGTVSRSMSVQQASRSIPAGRDEGDPPTEVRLTLDLPAGPATLKTWLESETGETRGAYFVDVTRK
jgi:arylsulfatase A-like enzyme